MNSVKSILESLADRDFDWSDDCGGKLSFDEWVINKAQEALLNLQGKEIVPDEAVSNMIIHNLYITHDELTSRGGLDCKVECDPTRGMKQFVTVRITPDNQRDIYRGMINNHRKAENGH